jgi:CheY-like chemotaxis protein
MIVFQSRHDVPFQSSGPLPMTTILVVDDEPDIREAMRFALEKRISSVMEAVMRTMPAKAAER